VRATTSQEKKCGKEIKEFFPIFDSIFWVVVKQGYLISAPTAQQRKI